MRRALIAAALLTILPACRLFMPERAARIDSCVARVPVLRAQPTRPYRVIKVVEGDTEGDVIERACSEGAEAVIILGPGVEYSTRGGVVPIGNAAVVTTRTTSREIPRGAAIQWVREQ